MNLSKTQAVRVISLLEANDTKEYVVSKFGDYYSVNVPTTEEWSVIAVATDSGELRNTQHTTTIKARILGCVQSVIVDYDMHQDGSIDIVRMTLEDELFPIEWSRSIEQLVMVELEKHLPKL